MSARLVTGASGGFGAEIVRDAFARGDEVVATARRPEEIPATDGALALPLDVSGRTPGTRRGRPRSTGVRPDRCSGERRRSRPLAQGLAHQDHDDV
jgi:NAD(P)-dependent dehydrogenase (short-subunit alcohol dehydrogenase family)